MQALAGAAGGDSAGALGIFFKVQKFIKGIGEDPRNEDGTVKGEDTDGAVNGVKPGVMDLVAVGGVAASAATFTFVGGPIAGTACGMTTVVSPYAAYQKRQLNQLGGFRGQANELRGHVNELHAQNDILTANIDKLADNVSGLEDVEGKLSQAAEAAGANMERFQYVISENNRLQELIKKNLRKQVLQDVLSIVVKADRNRDYTLNRVEIEMLIFRLNTLPSVEFNENNFRKLLKGKKLLTVTEVMDILRNLLQDDIDEEEAIFRIKVDAATN